MTRTIAAVRLRSYGFLHPGRERFKRVTKECWRVIPGATLYGAVAASLIRQDCRKGRATLENCRACVQNKQAACGYADLLQGAKEESWRFSPLVPPGVPENEENEEKEYTLQAYCRDARNQKPPVAMVSRAPRDRFSGSISEGRLHGVVSHMPFQEYWGFVIAPKEFITRHLHRALAALPFFPFGGGRGKFTQVEAAVTGAMTEDRFTDGLTIPPEGCTIQLLSPALGPESLTTVAGSHKFDLSGFRPQLYSTWRTGLYWEAGGLAEYGRGREVATKPRLGLGEGMRIIFREAVNPVKLKQLLIQGFGDPDFTRLGWGQMILEENLDEAHTTK